MKTKKRIVHVSITLIVIAVGIIGMKALTASKQRIEKRRPTIPTPMVRTIAIKTGPKTVRILGQGTVKPLREINLVPQVAGKVVHVSPALVNGGAFYEGETLLRIDPSDYEVAVTLAKAQVKDAESNLRLAEQETAAAREEWKLHSGKRSAENANPPPLVAKEPQLAAAQAKLEAHRADLSKALLNLERTSLKAPFDGRVSNENVDQGQYVSVGTSLATLYSTEAAEIVLPLEDEKTAWFHIPGFTPGDGAGAPAEVRARIAGQDRTWPAQVMRTQGELDEQTRMINVVVRAEKPYATKPPLVSGLFVTVEIQGTTLPHAAVIPRSALHQDNVVWVVDGENRLRFRQVEVALMQDGEALIKAGLSQGERLVTTLLQAVSDGMAVRTLQKEEQPS